MVKHTKTDGVSWRNVTKTFSLNFKKPKKQKKNYFFQIGTFGDGRTDRHRQNVEVGVYVVHTPQDGNRHEAEVGVYVVHTPQHRQNVEVGVYVVHTPQRTPPKCGGRGVRCPHTPTVSPQPTDGNRHEAEVGVYVVHTPQLGAGRGVRLSTHPNGAATGREGGVWYSRGAKRRVDRRLSFCLTACLPDCLPA